MVGGNFHSVPGFYELPGNEGYYELDGRGMIIFCPKGTPRVYRHRCISYKNATHTIGFGWYEIIYDFTTLSKLHTPEYELKYDLPTGFTTKASVQKLWLIDQVQTLTVSNKATLTVQ